MKKNAVCCRVTWKMVRCVQSLQKVIAITPYPTCTAAPSEQAQHVIRDLDSLSSPVTTVNYLSTLPVFRDPGSFTVSVLSAPRLPARSTASLGFTDLSPLLEAWGMDTDICQGIKDVFLTPQGQLSLELEGHVHCEAVVMPALHAAKTKKKSARSSDMPERHTSSDQVRTININTLHTFIRLISRDSTQ